MRTPAAILGALALAGCTLIPGYERPEPPVPDRFPGAGEDAGGAPAAADLDWREFLLDERLRAVVRQALEGNRDLRMAALDVERAAALLGVRRAELSPALGVQAAGERVRIPGSMSDSGDPDIAEAYSVDFGFLSWEIDLFGRIRSLAESALEQYFASEETRRAVRASLGAAAASGYLRLAADVEKLRLAEGTVAAQLATLEVIRASRDAGLASDLDLRQAESQVEAARVSVGGFRGLVAADRNALEVLLGGPLAPGLEPDGLRSLAGTAAIAAGLPSEVLLRRPDIRAAEHRLLAVNADIGAARAAFFPRISLTAALGTLSPDLSGLFEAGTRSWTFAPVIQQPVFAGGGPRARLRATEVEREIAVAAYEKAIQSAFAEVADGLALRGTLLAQREANDRLVVALEETLRLSEERYAAGIDGYLGVLIAQRALYTAQEANVNLRLAERANGIALYKALGGGGGEVRE